MADECCTPSKAPIACSLTAGELGEHQRRFRELAARSLARSERSSGSAVFEFRNGSGEIEPVVRELARLEKECCPFFDFTVSATAEIVRLEVSAPAEAATVVDALFEMITSGS